MDMGRIISIHNGMKNVNLDGGAMSQQLSEEINYQGLIDILRGVLNCVNIHDYRGFHQGLEKALTWKRGPYGIYGYYEREQRDSKDPIVSKLKEIQKLSNSQSDKVIYEKIQELITSLQSSEQEKVLPEARYSAAPKDLLDSHKIELHKDTNEYNKEFGRPIHIEQNYNEMGDAVNTTIYYRGAKVIINTQKNRRGDIGHNVFVMRNVHETPVKESVGCSHCNNTGIQDCTNCNGKGYIDWNWDTMSCGHCFGKGEYPCTRCNPEGYKDFLESEGEVSVEESIESSIGNPKDKNWFPGKVYDQRDPLIPVEHCIDCGLPTGRAGKNDDSLYDESGVGPFCEDCYFGNDPMDESIDARAAGELWSRDEMDFPDENYFKDNIAGEKTSDEDINDHDLTIQDQLEQEGLAEYKAPKTNVCQWCNKPKSSEMGMCTNCFRFPQKTFDLTEERGLCSHCGEEVIGVGLKLCDNCFRQSYDRANNRVNGVHVNRRVTDIAESKLDEAKFNEPASELNSDDYMLIYNHAKNLGISKLGKRKAEGKCIGCGNIKCSCKSKGKLRNRTNGIGKSEMREPSSAQINSEAERIKNRKSLVKETSGDYYIDPEFKKGLRSFIDAYAKKNRKEIEIPRNRAQMEHEIEWCQNAIKKLEELLVKKPSKRREIEQLKHQIREKELKLAFDPQYGGEVKELPIERKFADKLEEGLGKNKTLPELLRDSINKISL